MGKPMPRAMLFSFSTALLLAAAPAPATSGVIPAQWPGWQGGPGYGQEWEGRREHCARMRERLHEIRYRMQYASPWERDRMGTRFHEIRERLRHECWGHWREDE